MNSILDVKVNSLTSYARKLKSKWRKLVTGHENTRIRDHLRNSQKEPTYVKLFDKIAFTGGVLNIVICQYFLLSLTQYFWIWYSALMPLLMLARFYSFKNKNMHYFLLDFCYFCIILNYLFLFVSYGSPLLFKICFVYAAGPLPMAVIIWRNSLVFHDIDKIASIYIHLMPGLLFYNLRWYGNIHENETLSALDVLLAVFVYIFWQILYCIKTEYIDHEKLNQNPKLMTSLRYMASDYKNPTAIATLKICRKLGIYKKNENFDAHSFKTKLIFIATQFIVTNSWTIPTPLFFASRTIHLIYLITIFTFAVYNGAAYYIEIFSSRYQQQFEKRQNMQRVAQVAAEIAYEVATEKKRFSRNSSPQTSSLFNTSHNVSTAVSSSVSCNTDEPGYTPEYVVLDREECKDPHAQQVPDTSAEKEETTSDGSDEEDRRNIEVIHEATNAFVDSLMEAERNRYETENDGSGDGETDGGSGDSDQEESSHIKQN